MDPAAGTEPLLGTEPIAAGAVREEDLTSDQLQAVLAAERATRASKRVRQAVRDMVISLAVVIAVVMIVAHPWSQPKGSVQVVEWRPVATAFSQSVTWPVLVPGTLPAGWTSTSARIEPTVDGKTALHVGWITTGNQYAAIEESDTADVRYQRDQTDGGTVTGTVQLPAGPWQQLQSPDGTTRSLVRKTKLPTGTTATYIATGSATWQELEALANSLR